MTRKQKTILIVSVVVLAAAIVTGVFYQQQIATFLTLRQPTTKTGLTDLETKLQQMEPLQKLEDEPLFGGWDYTTEELQLLDEQNALISEMASQPIVSEANATDVIREQVENQDLQQNQPKGSISPPVKVDSIMLVDSRLWESLRNDINTWKDIIQEKYDRTVVPIPLTTQLAPEDLRAGIKWVYDNYDIQGVILVGQWPMAYWITPPGQEAYDRRYIVPMPPFYTELDTGIFSRDESDPEIQGKYHTYNRFNRDQREYEHNNDSYWQPGTYDFGPEIWLTSWRGTAIHNPPENQQERDLEIAELQYFIRKSTAYHRQESPYYENGEFFADNVLGLCSGGAEDLDCLYVDDWISEWLPGWYNQVIPTPSTYETFIPEFRQNGFKTLFFDVRAHSGWEGFWPYDGGYGVTSDDLLFQTGLNSGALATPICGCSSGVYEMPENRGQASYAMSLIMGAGIDLLSTGTPWPIANCLIFKGPIYDGMINHDLTAGEALKIVDAEYSYRLAEQYNFPPNEDHKYIMYLLPYGDPYLKLPQL